MESTFVFIDSGYLSKIAIHFFKGKPPPYSLDGFAIKLAKEQNLWCSGVFYYTASPYQSPNPTKDEMRRKAKHDRFVSKLRKIPNFIVREGRCQKTDDDYTQKGVDTYLTMDLMNVCSRDEVKQVILIACDTDFVPVLNKIRKEYKTEVILYYYTDRIRGSRFSMSNHILTACDKKCLIEKRHFDNCLFKKPSQ